MTPQVLVRYLETFIHRLLKYWSDTYTNISNDSSIIGQIPRKIIFNDSSSIGQMPRKVYSMTPQVLVRYYKNIFNDYSSVGQIPRKLY